MGLYRVCVNLWMGKSLLVEGTVARLSSLSPGALARLEAKGSVRRVTGPPLSELPGWQVRSVRLARLGIVGSVEFMEVEPERIAGPLRVSPALIRRWQHEVEHAITVVPSKGG